MTFGGSLEPLEVSDAGVLPGAVGRLDETPRHGRRHGRVDLVKNFGLDLGECIACPIVNASFARDQNAAVVQPATRKRDEIVRVRRLLCLQPEDAGKLVYRSGMKIVEAEVCLRPKLMFVLRRTTLVQSAQARDGDRWRAEGFRHVSQEVARENRDALQRSTAGAQEQQLQRRRHQRSDRNRPRIASMSSCSAERTAAGRSHSGDSGDSRDQRISVRRQA